MRHHRGTPDERPGTGCHYAEVNGQIACTVHCCYLPCWREGQPASPVPVHMGSDHYSREELLHEWRETTAGQRPLVLHRGPIVGGAHRVDEAGACWCDPDRVEPDPVIV